MALFPLGILSAAGAGVVDLGSYDLLETQILGSAQASITFSSLGTYSSTYKHLQIRAVVRHTNANVGALGYLRANADSGSNYTAHRIWGNSFNVLSGVINDTGYRLNNMPGANSDTNNYGAFVCDILDAYSTTKFKTIRSLGGNAAGEIGLYSGHWRNTDSITSLNYSDLGNTAAGSRFSLYGIKG
jgi:hypothetical protein